MTPAAFARIGLNRGNAPALLTLAVALLLLLGIVGASVWLAARNAEALVVAEHVQDVQATVAELTIALYNAESGQRGYLLTGRETYLTRYEEALAVLPSLHADLVANLPLDAPAQRLTGPLQAATDAKLSEMRRTIDLHRNGDPAAALALVRTDEGKLRMDEIRRLTSAIGADQDARLAHLFTAIRRRGVLLVALDAFGVLLVVVLGTLGGIGVRRTLRTLQAARHALAASNASLESKVARRTADLTEANGELQRFAYIVSHDLRAPLVNIMGFTSELEQAAQVLSQHAEADGAAIPESVAAATHQDIPEALRFIRASTAKMDRLITAILSLSRGGRRAFTPEPLPMRPLLEAIADSLAHQVQRTGATIEFGDLPNLVADRLAVEQVFANLIENALKYAQPGRPVRIAIQGRHDGPMLRYSVADTGRGIAERDRERVFELFRRAGDQTVPGEGIGLAHVRALVRRLGGSIGFESVLGEGTTFHLRLPPTPIQPAAEAA